MEKMVAGDVAEEPKEDTKKEVKENINGLNSCISSDTFIKEVVEEANVASSSSYTLTSHSQFSSDVERWLTGSSMESTGVQNSRVQLVPRSTIATTTSFGMPGMWYLAALVLPLFNARADYTHWRCNPSTILNTAALIYAQIIIFCEDLRRRVRRIAREQMARELFATLMDVVLTVYAVGFLILSMYQASFIG